MFGKVDTEAEQELSAAAEIRSIPTLMAFKKGADLQSTRRVASARAGRPDSSGPANSMSMRRSPRSQADRVVDPVGRAPRDTVQRCIVNPATSS